MHSPFRTLFKKEWKQSRMLRTVSILMMVLLPPFVIMVAESASRGWVPMFSISSYDVTQLFMDAVPMLLVVAWLFFAAVFTAQAFAGDRAAGNEPFLLERPVSRTVTWRARLAATLANGLVALLAGWLIWLAYFLALGDPPEGKVVSLSWLLLAVGAASILAVICGGMAATAFLDTPMIGVLGGLILAAVPAGAAAFLAGLSPFAVLFRLDHDVFPTPLINLSRLPVGMILPVLLYPAFVAVSWYALCRGEPAGRGSRARGVKVLVPSILGVLVLFLALAPIAVRANVDAYLDNNILYPSPAAGRCAVQSGYGAAGGWLIDAASGEKLRFLQIPSTDMTWRADGKYLALNEGKTFFWPGWFVLTLRILDGETGDNLLAYDFPASLTVWDISWVGDRLLLSLVDFELWRRLEHTDRLGEAARLFLAEEGPNGWRDGTVRELDHNLSLDGMGGRFWRILTARGSDHAYLVRSNQETTEVGDGKTLVLDSRVTIERLVLQGGSARAMPVAEVPGDAYNAGHHLSPSGRYWTVVGEYSPEVKRYLRIFDLSSGQPVPLEHTRNVGLHAWLKDDELVWVQAVDDRTVLHRWRQEEGRTTLMETEPGGRLGLDRSPDGERVLLSSYRLTGDPATGQAELDGTWIYRAGSGELVPSGLVFKGSASGMYYTRWADPETILWGDGGKLYLEKIDNPGNPVEMR